tara:strand:- start:157 stop:432 length:276 start_codon:yes stop_codon:yes gene_type:complete
MDEDNERRKSPMRRDFNDAIRDVNGRFSWPKLSVILGQLYSLYLIDYHKDDIIYQWDALLILLSVLIAPHILIRVIQSKFPVSASGKPIGS